MITELKNHTQKSEVLFLKALEGVNHSKEKRAQIAKLLSKNPEMLINAFKTIAKVDDPISCKAAWGIEFLFKEKLLLLKEHKTEFLTVLPLIHFDAAIRPLAKICEQLCLAHYHPKSSVQFLSKNERKQIVSACFDWLITPQKVAAKAYAMTSLYELGKEFDWIHPELQLYIETNYQNQSAAFKARARMILKKIATKKDKK